MYTPATVASVPVTRITLDIIARSVRAAFFAVAVASCVPLTGAQVTDGPQPDAPAGARILVTVVEVTDGDTIRVDLEGAETPVRLIGIDTPEKDGPFTDEECFGEQASLYTTDALEGREVELEFDVDRTDPFDRTLAYAWLDGELFNERILLEGYAVQVTFPPNVRYVDRFTVAERRAREESLGVWSACFAA